MTAPQHDAAELLGAPRPHVLDEQARRKRIQRLAQRGATFFDAKQRAHLEEVGAEQRKEAASLAAADAWLRDTSSTWCRAKPANERRGGNHG